MSKQQLYDIFDDMLSELIWLLKGTKQRFILTNEYLDLQMQEVGKH